jgi:hypothetical protein
MSLSLDEPHVRPRTARDRARSSTKGATGSALDGVHLPGPGDAFEFLLASVLELDARASDEVFDG